MTLLDIQIYLYTKKFHIRTTLFTLLYQEMIVFIMLPDINLIRDALYDISLLYFVEPKNKFSNPFFVLLH